MVREMKRRSKSKRQREDNYKQRRTFFPQDFFDNNLRLNGNSASTYLKCFESWMVRTNIGTNARRLHAGEMQSGAVFFGFHLVNFISAYVSKTYRVKAVPSTV